MPSPEFVALQTYIERLRDHLLHLDTEYDALAPEDFTRAVAFRVLASAAIEGYVESRCRSLAATGADRFLKNQPTRTGRALVIWYNARRPPAGAFPLKEEEHLPDVDLVNAALKAYVDSVAASHGITGKDLGALVWPLGARAGDVDPQLVDRLDALGTARDRAVHVRLVKIREQTTPDAEWKIVDGQVMPLLATLDDALDELCNTY